MLEKDFRKGFLEFGFLGRVWFLFLKFCWGDVLDFTEFIIGLE